MLQQTQAGRVAAKYLDFINRFPSFAELAVAPAGEVIAAWQGLGYNRRALALHKLANQIVASPTGRLPNTVAELELLPGIGPATARSIAAFSYNLPTVFIETNIRRVFIDYFFSQREGVSDREILPLVELTLAADRPRQWYWALMDYGSWLGRTKINPNRRSQHYSRQSRFKGSHRQRRGAVLRQLVKHRQLSLQRLGELLDISAQQVSQVVDQLEREGFVVKQNDHCQLAE